jgi:hypothetical protein
MSRDKRGVVNPVVGGSSPPATASGAAPRRWLPHASRLAARLAAQHAHHDHKLQTHARALRGLLCGRLNAFVNDSWMTSRDSQ